MGKITDLDVLAATSNGDGTHDGVKLAQWLFEALTGKALSRDDAEVLVQEGIRRGRQAHDADTRARIAAEQKAHD